MTHDPTPFFSMSMKAGESLMQDLTRAVAASQAAQVKTKTRFQNWKAVVKQPQDAQATALVEAGMMGFFLDFLFGMPIFSGVSDAAKGLLDIGLMGHSDMGRDNMSAMPDMAALNALISSQSHRRDGALSSQRNQTAQMKKMRQMVMMMLLMMMQDAENGGSGDSEGVSLSQAPEFAQDVLRHPKLARFKQNRHSLACIRTMFQNQADTVAPRFNAPRCQAA
jgi:hypothetical protein